MRPPSIAIDAPCDVDYETRLATLHEGELFGEMSCMFGSPRSATIVADRDWYYLEMLRNILDAIQGDAGYREEMDRVYKQRVLEHHLRRLSIFNDLTEEQFERVRDEVELLRCKVGHVICDENDRSDSLYIIRSGLVKTVKNVSNLLGVGDVLDWPGLVAKLSQGEQEQAGPLSQVRQKLPEPVRAALQRGVPALTDADRQEIVLGLNDFIKDPAVPDPKNPQAAKDLPVTPALTEYLQKAPKDPKQWADQGRRLYGRLYLEAICPGILRPRDKQAGRDYILSYLSKGDFIGEIGLMTGQPRSATCVAFVHPEPGQGHGAPSPTAKWRKEEPIVELVRLPEPAFRRLLAESPAIRSQVEKVVAERRQRQAEMQRQTAWDDRRTVSLTGRFEELGLIQGQKLMLIDLDRCTRCDECVRACVNTHDDGRTRLFLDGPRFGKYLVPATCRSCLDPVCLIGCPVGSIHRGDNRQIVIEDWCIGCGLCAVNCPYGSIQMHDLGIIPEGAPGWRFCPADVAGDDRAWTAPRYADRSWPVGQAPFRLDPDLHASLRQFRNGQTAVAQEAVPAICFRYEFQLEAARLNAALEFKLEATSTDGPLTVWLNGQEVTTQEKPKRGKREYKISHDNCPLRAGRNVVAVKATPTPKDLEVLLELRLDEVHTPNIPLGLSGDISEKQVTERAVVCDLCSTQYGQRPACVTACPHDAAMRVNARFEFPV
jgi:CRP-like cAMP-binding protein